MSAPRLDRLDKNLLINGQLNIWQRGTSYSGVSASNYLADRFRYINATTVSRQSDVPVPELNYSIEVGNSSASFPGMFQRVEATFSRGLVGKTLTLWFYAKRIAGTSSLKCEIITPNAVNDYAGVTTTYTNTFATYDGTWRLYKYEFEVTANMDTRGFEVRIYNDNASAATFRMARLMVVVGEFAEDDIEFPRRSFGEELQFCQRYFHRLTRGEGFSGSFFGWRNTDAGWAAGPYKFPVTMRANPVFSISSLGQWNLHIPSVTNASLTTLGATWVTSGAVANSGNAQGTDAWVFGGTYAAGGPNVLNLFPNVDGAYIQWDAEL